MTRIITLLSVVLALGAGIFLATQSSAKRAPMTQPKVEAPVADAAAPVEVLVANKRCSTSSDCPNSKCSSGQCGACSTSSDCKYGKCSSSKCGSCSTSSDCGSFGSCSSGRCQKSPY